jgi:hypothetical protein
VKTRTSQRCPELFSQLSSSDRSCQCISFYIDEIEMEILHAKLGVGVFTQPGSKTDLTAPKSDFRFTPESGLKSDIPPCPVRANSGPVLELSLATADHVDEDPKDLRAVMFCQRRIECSNMSFNLFSHCMSETAVVSKCHIF